MTVDEFKNHIKNDKFEDVLNNTILGGNALHVDATKKAYLQRKIAEKFRVDQADVNIIIVGSAKLGFSISEKKRKGEPTLPRYRTFSPASDVDIAIISPKIFEMIWNDLSIYSFNRPYYPWESKKLGDYLVCGWMRPDHFPKGVRLRKCDDWWDLFRYLSGNHYLGSRQIRGALFYNFEQLQTYHSKALAECIQIESLKP